MCFFAGDVWLDRLKVTPYVREPNLNFESGVASLDNLGCYTSQVRIKAYPSLE
jgi:hypothetical protein